MGEGGRVNMETFVSISPLAQCGICLETFCCPVTIECGHSFCSECITKYWDGPGGTLSCPQCRRTFTSRPLLSKNICLDQITEVLQRVGTNRNPGSDPDPDLRALCKAQHQNLQFYCETERVAFCSLCNSQDHKTHRTVALNEELTRAQELIANRQQSVESQIKTTSEEISAWKERTASQQGCPTLKIPDCLPCPAAQSDVTDRLKKLRPATRELSDLLKKHLEAFTQGHFPVNTPTGQEDAQAQSAESQDSPHNLAPSQSASLSQSMDMSAPSQSVGLSQSMDMSASSQSAGLSQSTDMSASLHDDGRLTLSVGRSVRQCHLPPQSRQELMQYLTGITFDPNTASPLLHVSDNRRRVTNMHPKLQNYPKHKKRFLHHSQVLAHQLFSDGRHYWEISVSGSPVLFGLSYPHINRSSKFQSSCLGRNNASWCLELAEGSGRFWHCDQPGDPVPSSYQHFGLYLDIPGQTLAFYGISGSATLLHHLQVTFTHPLLPAFQINRGATIQIEN
ncbi:tripartite motif-containing protein 65-like isoform X2 [Scyliorhinus canicula]|uniref:tripartite motif-containing protein 65-like isoform X2 n=1 Tax=Scyliorhinus canicula TaxID=7830 RepID=UPI0018F47BBE|nr:tripartite motif-containing protein 65-like isoform X2 [Scyliorhinus canicula]